MLRLVIDVELCLLRYYIRGTCMQLVRRIIQSSNLTSCRILVIFIIIPWFSTVSEYTLSFSDVLFWPLVPCPSKQPSRKWSSSRPDPPIIIQFSLSWSCTLHLPTLHSIPSSLPSPPSYTPNQEKEKEKQEPSEWRSISSICYIISRIACAAFPARRN